MNKGHLSEAVAKRTNMPKPFADAIVTVVLDEISRALADGKEIRLTGFGTLKVRESAARTSRNPKTGEPVEVPARKTVKFLPGVRLLEFVRGEKDPATVERIFFKRSKNSTEE